jgi:hypothetical protein
MIFHGERLLNLDFDSVVIRTAKVGNSLNRVGVALTKKVHQKTQRVHRL